MRRWIGRAAVTLLIVAAGGLVCAGEEAPRPAPAEQFDSLVAEIQVLRSDLEKIEGRERGLLTRLDRMELEASLHIREIERLAMQEKRIESEQIEARRELARVQDRARESADDLARELRRAYVSGRGRELRLLLALDDPSRTLHQLAYLDALARRDSQLLERLRQDRADLESLTRSLRERAATIDGLAARERRKSIELEKVRQEQSALLLATREKDAAHRQAIAELTRAAEALERAITTGEAAADGSEFLEAVDAGKLRGTLEWPVTGRVAVPFGEIRHPRFRTVVPHPGLDIEAEPRTPVRAVLAGKVVYSRRFEGYGNTILVDHGRGYVSVYARLGIRKVVEGQWVLARQIIGLSGDMGPGGRMPRIYFEFRRDGRAVNPSSWLKANENRGRSGSG
ncbi:MAG: murein hydrolase activator EnvC family protein, partial [Acidobacteriota bacterium]